MKLSNDRRQNKYWTQLKIKEIEPLEQNSTLDELFNKVSIPAMEADFC
jgi:hypothetical protein